MKRRHRRQRNEGVARRSVNTLSWAWQQPSAVLSSPDWVHTVFDGPTGAAFVIDLGCGDGQFPKALATHFRSHDPEWLQPLPFPPRPVRVLGLEIQPELAASAQADIEASGTGDHATGGGSSAESDGRGGSCGLAGRVACIACNVSVDLERVLEAIPAAGGTVASVCVQFPDPHFRRKHAKRRVVQMELVNVLARHLPAGSTVVLQSDVEPVQEDMEGQFRACGAFCEVNLPPEHPMTTTIPPAPSTALVAATTDVTSGAAGIGVNSTMTPVAQEPVAQEPPEETVTASPPSQPPRKREGGTGISGAPDTADHHFTGTGDIDQNLSIPVPSTDQRSAAADTVVTQVTEVTKPNVTVTTRRARTPVVNPWGAIITEREAFVRRSGKAIYRALFRRNELPWPTTNNSDGSDPSSADRTEAQAAGTSVTSENLPAHATTTSPDPGGDEGDLRERRGEQKQEAEERGPVIPLLES